jgi:cytochrome c biogenesis protein CcmG/thiol:disulfide interchange protein DsbE
VRRSQLLIWGGVFAFLALIGFGLLRSSRGRAEAGIAPDFDLLIYDGSVITLSEQRDKIVMVDIWASWCIPCREEATMLETLWQDYKDDGFLLLGVAYADTDRAANQFLTDFGITYPNGPDIGLDIYETYRVKGVPEKFLIDRNGEIRKVFVGPAGEAEYRREIEALLNE